MKSFNYEARAIRVLFGQSTISQVDAEAARAGVTRALVLSTPNQSDEAARVAGYLGRVHASTFTGATMHTPEDVTEYALEITRSVRANGIVAVGGGSTIGLGKAIAIRTGLPQIVLPTTYAGSEMTAILGETRNGVKDDAGRLDEPHQDQLQFLPSPRAVSRYDRAVLAPRPPLSAQRWFCLMNFSNAVSCCPTTAFVGSSVSSELALNFVWAEPTNTSGVPKTCASRNVSAIRR